MIINNDVRLRESEFQFPSLPAVESPFRRVFGSEELKTEFVKFREVNMLFVEPIASKVRVAAQYIKTAMIKAELGMYLGNIC